MTKSLPSFLRLESLEDSALTRLEQELTRALRDNPEVAMLRCEGMGFRYIQGWRRLVDALGREMSPSRALEFIIPDSQSRALARSAGLPLVARLRES